MSTTAVATIDTTRPGIPLSRLVKVELRKMFDTRAGFWLLMSIAIVSSIATIMVLIFADDSDLEFGLFAQAIGIPMAVLLPVIAILSVTGEWSQRTGLISFTLVPHRARIISAKAAAAIIVGIVSMLVAFGIGALGNVVGSAIAGTDMRWDVSFQDLLRIIFANVLGLLVGFMLGVLIRNSAGAIVAYFVYSFVMPGLLELLAHANGWFQDHRPWLDFNFAQTPLFEDGPTGEQWAQIAVSGTFWFIIPMIFGVWAVLRSEVK